MWDINVRIILHNIYTIVWNTMENIGGGGGGRVGRRGRDGNSEKRHSAEDVEEK